MMYLVNSLIKKALFFLCNKLGNLTCDSLDPLADVILAKSCEDVLESTVNFSASIYAYLISLLILLSHITVLPVMLNNTTVTVSLSYQV